MNESTISILCPTRYRLKFVLDLIGSAIDTAYNPDGLEFIFYIDDDDDSYDDLEGRASIYTDNIKVIRGQRIVLSEMWNVCWRQATAEIYMHCGDDIRFRTQDWDKIVINSFKSIPDKIGLLFGNDGYDAEGEQVDRTFGTHSFVHKNWTDTVGYFVPPYFSSDYNDTWLNDVAGLIERSYYIPIYTEHLHPVLGKYHWDKNHHERMIRHKEDNVEDIYYSEKMIELRKEWASKLIQFIKNFNIGE